MIWIILFVIGVIFLIIGLREDREGLYCTGFFVSLLSCFLFFVFGLTCIHWYPSLSKQKEEIKTLKRNIIYIKNARYSNRKNGSFISGSIENANQSTNLSKYYIKIANKEAEYNGDLTEAKIYKSFFIYKFFMASFLIDEKIFQLEKIKD